MIGVAWSRCVRHRRRAVRVSRAIRAVSPDRACDAVLRDAGLVVLRERLAGSSAPRRSAVDAEAAVGSRAPRSGAHATTGSARCSDPRAGPRPWSSRRAARPPRGWRARGRARPRPHEATRRRARRGVGRVRRGRSRPCPVLPPPARPDRVRARVLVVFVDADERCGRRRAARGASTAVSVHSRRSALRCSARSAAALAPRAAGSPRKRRGDESSRRWCTRFAGRDRGAPTDFAPLPPRAPPCTSVVDEDQAEPSAPATDFGVPRSARRQRLRAPRVDASRPASSRGTDRASAMKALAARPICSTPRSRSASSRARAEPVRAGARTIATSHCVMGRQRYTSAVLALAPGVRTRTRTRASVRHRSPPVAHSQWAGPRRRWDRISTQRRPSSRSRRCGSVARAGADGGGGRRGAHARRLEDRARALPEPPAACGLVSRRRGLGARVGAAQLDGTSTPAVVETLRDQPPRHLLRRSSIFPSTQRSNAISMPAALMRVSVALRAMCRFRPRTRELLDHDRLQRHRPRTCERRQNVRAPSGPGRAREALHQRAGSSRARSKRPIADVGACRPRRGRARRISRPPGSCAASLGNERGVRPALASADDDALRSRRGVSSTRAPYFVHRDGRLSPSHAARAAPARRRRRRRATRRRRLRRDATHVVRDERLLRPDAPLEPRATRARVRRSSEPRSARPRWSRLRVRRFNGVVDRAHAPSTSSPLPEPRAKVARRVGRRAVGRFHRRRRGRHRRGGIRVGRHRERGGRTGRPGIRRAPRPGPAFRSPASDGVDGCRIAPPRDSRRGDASARHTRRPEGKGASCESRRSRFPLFLRLFFFVAHRPGGSVVHPLAARWRAPPPTTPVNSDGRRTTPRRRGRGSLAPARSALDATRRRRRGRERSPTCRRILVARPAAPRRGMTKASRGWWLVRAIRTTPARARRRARHGRPLRSVERAPSARESAVRGARPKAQRLRRGPVGGGASVGGGVAGVDRRARVVRAASRREPNSSRASRDSAGRASRIRLDALRLLARAALPGASPRSSTRPPGVLRKIQPLTCVGA